MAKGAPTYCFLGKIAPLVLISIVVYSVVTFSALFSGVDDHETAQAVELPFVPGSKQGLADLPAGALLKWAQAANASFASLRIASTEDGALVTAARTIHARDELVVVPRSLWLSRESALRSELGDVLEEIFEGRFEFVADEVDVLVLHIMAEWLKGDVSHFAPYLNLLPRAPAPSHEVARQV